MAGRELSIFLKLSVFTAVAVVADLCWRTVSGVAELAKDRIVHQGKDAGSEEQQQRQAERYFSSGSVLRQEQSLRQ